MAKNVGSGHDCAQRYYVGTALRTGHGCPSLLARSVTPTQNIGSVITTFKRHLDPTHHALRAQRSYPDRKSARQDVLNLCLSGASRVTLGVIAVVGLIAVLPPRHYGSQFWSAAALFSQSFSRCARPDLKRPGFIERSESLLLESSTYRRTCQHLRRKLAIAGKPRDGQLKTLCPQKKHHHVCVAQ